MKNKLAVGMYCYNKTNRKLGIGKIISFQSNNNINVRYKNDIELVSIGNLKASFDIINLIEKGDYINGLPVSKISEYIDTYEKCVGLFGSFSDWKNEDIKSVTTKEQMEQMSYRIGD